jgi:uncharacterized SAM-binding protein YcdF (DUF218 family)
MPRRRWPIRIAAVVAVAACLALLPRLVGEWLVVNDPLQRADAVVVLGGQMPFRAMEAAAIYRQGLASEVWLTQGALHEEDYALERLGIGRTAEHLLSKEVLTRLGVPPQAIRILPERVENTAEELRSVAGAARAAGVSRVILVTSKYHTRRVKILWRALTPGETGAAVRFARDDPSDIRHWWRHTGDALAVSREIFGIANAWAGFPVKSERW